MKLSKENQKLIIDFVDDCISNPYGFVKELDQSMQLEDGWYVHLEIKKEAKND